MHKKVDEISKVNEKGETVKRFFVHFKHWFKGWDTERKRLMSSDNERLKIVYDEPWYWMVKASDPAAAYKPREDSGKHAKKKVFVTKCKFCDITGKVEIIYSGVRVINVSFNRGL